MPQRSQRPPQTQADVHREAKRAKLPELWRHTMWHPQCGLIVSPFTRAVPKDALSDANSEKLEDFMRPRFLNDTNIYLAFYPRKPIHKGELFSVLAIGSNVLPRTIVVERSHRGDSYVLDRSVEGRWYRLENALLSISGTLLDHHEKAKYLPHVTFPPAPSTFGYRAAHRSRAEALAAVKRSREQFRMLSALATFAFSLWLTEFEDDCFDEARAVLEKYGPRLPHVWYESLLDSIVCNLSPALRPGGFLDPFTTQWGPMLYRFTRASVPIWLVWGYDPKTREPVDAGMVHHYFPPPDVVALAKERPVLFSGHILPHVVLPHEQTYSFRGDRNNAPPSTAPSVLIPTNDSQHSARQSSPMSDVYDAADMYTSGTNPDFPPPPNPAIDRTLITNAGSYQRSGETWHTFSERMRRDLEKRKQIEDEKERQSRVDREAFAARGLCSKTATVYEWEQDEVDPTVYRRAKIDRDNIEFEWDDYTEHQRFYWSHVNQWDLCRQLPKNPLGAKPVLSNNDLADLEAAEELPHSTESTTPNVEPVGPAMQTVQPVAPTAVNDHHTLQFPSIVEYLRQRHGFDATRGLSWYSGLHGDEKLCLKEEQTAEVLIRLMYGPKSTTLTEMTFSSIVDFYNTAVGADAKERAKANADHKRLGTFWDLSPASMEPLVCDLRRLVIQRVFTPDPHPTELYILRPPSNSKDPSPWYVATPSATTVLLVFRERWTTMGEIARGLLASGIPFRTVLEVDRPSSVECKWTRKSRALGLRSGDFVPTVEDYRAYEKARGTVLESSLGRAVRLRGGIMWRLAEGTVPDLRVLDGPVLGDEVVGVHGKKVFVDDGIDEETLDIVAGVYHVKPKGLSTTHSSYWPKHWHWQASGYAGDQWNPAAENFYQSRKAEFAANKYSIKRAKDWKQQIKLHKNGTERALRGSENFAADFIARSKTVC